MGFFSKILDKLGLKKDAPAAAPVKPAATPSTIKPMTNPPTAVAAAKPQVAVAQAKDDDIRRGPAPTAISTVDVVKHLEQLSAGKNLDWKVSIVDLLKLLEIDSSREARNELATELGCPADLMKDSAKMNVWLHKEVLKKIAENGGNIPQSLLD